MLHVQERDASSQRLYYSYDRGEYQMTEDKFRNNRHGYYGSISFVDDQIEKIVATLEATGQLDNIVLTAHYGDMLGERGLWYKMSFYEWSSCIPIVVIRNQESITDFVMLLVKEYNDR